MFACDEPSDAMVRIKVKRARYAAAHRADRLGRSSRIDFTAIPVAPSTRSILPAVTILAEHSYANCHFGAACVLLNVRQVVSKRDYST